MDIDTIIQKAKAKDPKALNEIYTLYYPKMVGICMNIIKEGDDVAHDLVHDAFILAFASINKLQKNERFAEWLTTIVRNVALKHIARKDRLHSVSLESIAPNNEALLDYSSVPDSEMNIKDILDLVAQLPEGYGTIFRLSVIEDFLIKRLPICSALNLIVPLRSFRERKEC